MTSESAPTVSVVVVTRNEEAHIAECLGSIFDLCHDGPTFEVVLVDSNSTDGSVSIATDFPIDVLQIPADDIATPGAGRYVGTEYTAGDYVLFVDGDMQLETEWLEFAIDALSQPNVAGVGGHLNSVAGHGRRRDVDALRGVALYERDALEAVDGFDPFLLASEDQDLGYRLKSAGYRLLQLPVVVAHHSESHSLGEPLRRWRQGYFHGVGQAVRNAGDDPRVMGRHLYSLRHAIAAVGWALLGVVLLGLVSSRRSGAIWAGLSVLGLGGYAARSSPRELFVDGCSYVLTVVGLLLGLLGPETRDHSYPMDRIEVIKRAEDRA